MPHSPGPHKYPWTRIPPARRYLSGHVVVAARVPLSKARPLPTKEGVILRTVGEAANYVLALPADRGELCQRWRHATKLILEQADAAAVSHQVHLALFYDAQLDIKAMDALGRVR